MADIPRDVVDSTTKRIFEQRQRDGRGGSVEDAKRQAVKIADRSNAERREGERK